MAPTRQPGATHQRTGAHLLPLTAAGFARIDHTLWHSAPLVAPVISKIPTKSQGERGALPRPKAELPTQRRVDIGAHARQGHDNSFAERNASQTTFPTSAPLVANKAARLAKGTDSHIAPNDNRSQQVYTAGRVTSGNRQRANKPGLEFSQVGCSDTTELASTSTVEQNTLRRVSQKDAQLATQNGRGIDGHVAGFVAAETSTFREDAPGGVLLAGPGMDVGAEWTGSHAARPKAKSGVELHHRDALLPQSWDPRQHGVPLLRNDEQTRSTTDRSCDFRDTGLNAVRAPVPEAHGHNLPRLLTPANSVPSTPMLI
jgi:hypothetical protein